jgi:hypothetical protein
MQDVLVTANEGEFLVEVSPSDVLAKKIKIQIDGVELSGEITKAVFGNPCIN